MDARSLSVKFLRFFTLLLTVSLFAALVASAQEKPLKVTAPKKVKKELLDGKKYVGQFIAKGKTSGSPDTLVFSKGKFRSRFCRTYGFRRAAYTATQNKDQIAFSADTKSKKEGKMVWKGSVRGDVLEASAVWTKPNSKAPVEYTFKGTLKKKKK
jgi:hypothetical protein